MMIVGAAVLAVVVWRVFAHLNRPEERFKSAAYVDRRKHVNQREQRLLEFLVRAGDMTVLRNAVATCRAAVRQAQADLSEARTVLAAHFHPLVLLTALGFILAVEGLAAMHLLNAAFGMAGVALVVAGTMAAITVVGLTHALRSTMAAAVESPETNRKLLAGLTVLAYALVMGTLAFLRVLSLDVETVGLLVTTLLVVLTVFLTAGPGFLGDLTIRPFLRALEPWQQVRVHALTVRGRRSELADAERAVDQCEARQAMWDRFGALYDSIHGRVDGPDDPPVASEPAEPVGVPGDGGEGEA
jgi:hypothetical protein